MKTTSLPSPPAAWSRRWKVAALLLLCAVITITQMRYVGDPTVYTRTAARQEMHEAVSLNRAPEGGWHSRGMNGMNIRILTVRLAETIGRIGGTGTLRAYRIVDLSTLFLTLALLFVFLEKWLEPVWRLVCVLYVGCILPLTFAHHAFHPEDRIGMLGWLLALWLIREDKVIWFAAILCICILIKWDAVVLPGLYFVAHATWRNWKAAAVRTALLFALAFGILGLLRSAIPGGFDDLPILSLMRHNLQMLVSMNVAYPPLLGFGLLIPLSAAGLLWGTTDRFVRGAALYSIPVIIPHLLMTNFHEIRAQMGVMLLLLPAATIGLRFLLAPPVSGVEDSWSNRLADKTRA